MDSRTGGREIVHASSSYFVGKQTQYVQRSRGRWPRILKETGTARTWTQRLLRRAWSRYTSDFFLMHYHHILSKTDTGFTEQDRCGTNLNCNWHMEPWPIMFVGIVRNFWEEGCHETLRGRGRLKSHGLSETPIVWGNTSLGVARHIRMRLFEPQWWWWLLLLPLTVF